MIYFFDKWLQSFKNWRAARMIRSMEHINRSKFKYIASVPAVTRWIDVGYDEISYYILYENGYGQKYYDYNKGSWLTKDSKKHAIYSTVIIPWLKGNFTSDQIIQRYL